MPRPPFVVRTSELPSHLASYPSPCDSEKLSIGRDLGRAAGSRAIGAWHERLEPGRRTSFTHAHLREEELIYVLAGTPTLRWIQDGVADECGLGPGDFVAFPAGTGIAHTVWNRSEGDVELLVVGERRLGERTTYPEDAEWVAWRDVNRPLRAWGDASGPIGDAKAPALLLETERLVLRPWGPAEAHDFLALRISNQARLAEWMRWAHTIPSLDEQLAQIIEWDRAFWSGGDVIYGLFEPDGKPVGGVGMHNRSGALGKELGYWVTGDREGKGYVTEAVRAMLRLAFEVYGVDRVEIHTDPGNLRSRAVPERLGFLHEATLPRRSVGGDGAPADSVIYTMYRSGFDSSGIGATQLRAFDALSRRLI
jgi:uncharacterized cupin superfamily protein